MWAAGARSTSRGLPIFVTRFTAPPGAPGGAADGLDTELTVVASQRRRRHVMQGIGVAVVIAVALLVGARIKRHSRTAGPAVVAARTMPPAPSPAGLAPPRAASAVTSRAAPPVPRHSETRTPSAADVRAPRSARAADHVARATDPKTAPTPEAAPTRPAARAARAVADREPEPARRERTHGSGSHATTHHHHTRAVATKRVAPGAGDAGAAHAAYQRGSGLLLGGDAPGAVAAYEDAVRVAPADPEGYRGLGLAYEKQGRVEDAARAFRRYLKLAPRSRDRELVARRLQRLVHPDADAP
jgi:hypothetical protein